MQKQAKLNKNIDSITKLMVVVNIFTDNVVDSGEMIEAVVKLLLVIVEVVAEK